MIVDVSMNILIVGLGLLGGSYARGLKRFGFRIGAITKEQKDIDYALREGIIDEGTTEIDERLIGEADLVVFALYPHIFVEWIREHQRLLKSGVLLTDVTGVKRSVVYQIQDMLRDDVEFIAAHPMAGREVSGVENSTEKMFIGANYIVTPTAKNTPEAIQTCVEIGRLLGFSRVATLSPEEHDEMIGFLSQLTHCIAITLMTCNDKENMEKFTGDSFRDLTRIARINDLMWSELFIANKDALLHQMNLFIDKFTELKNMLETEDVDGMRAMMRYSTARREKFDKK
ncbi:MAG: prephenate dehydrogenase/arogenate dehydrogenase family protein [Eubacteriales bacterium]|nr:prephenate dehydrogenase/arogenate dehydrogenase family protein [Clostridiales bacterium]MDD7774855.1 prephenate dehydrogenase/arogenate dehydrogenase family protein [Eubacteriales bacterium]MDY3942220.1 prephenate dehydrogenase/arogenate dehydrogenase family protein [Eubacteriales bacterium]